ncbi:MAG: DUF2336 domain-containing protein [Alphaproteobacteria bacterium]|nr:DUF2336 domain-containing protein [Alphaproteobacteria bacterium]MDE2012856.1 DUF2336 domain-containing protein [Alphaproteobacteria bacterium]MDE2074270.1 DUF2336 domain-containing protein [Alphaproteobacteria bacterium]MDE2350291.1 DUF2336 domain-containing protein [Alphaproteobacteria bacterium]
MVNARSPERPKEAAAPMLSREDVVRILEQRGEELRAELARCQDAEPEVLLFIAKEGNAAARRAVAANPSSPAVANRLLATDPEDEVRQELARKIGRLLPNLTSDAREHVRRLTIQTLELLAADELPRVRQILAEEVKSLDCVPKRVIARLARDIECVSAPILEYSPLLSDADLIEIITTAQARHALVAVARRNALSAKVSDVLAEVMDVPSVAALLENASSNIRQKTIDKIIDHAARIHEWHEPLVMRHDLSQRAIARIAGFVCSALIDRLAARHQLDADTRALLRQKLRERLDDEKGAGGAASVAAARFRDGTLDENAVMTAARDGQRELVVQALSLLAAMPPETVQRILETYSAKPITALVWRAGLSMRAAFRIQTSLLHLPASELLPARDGVRFPLSDDEMRWHLSYFGLDD